MNDTSPPRPKRKPTTFPTERLGGTPGGGGGRVMHSPPAVMLRPEEPLPSVSQADWLPFRDAQAQLSGIFAYHQESSEFLWLRILNGVIPITCEALVYERADGRGFDRQTYSWPPAEARLWEQLLRARGNPKAQFRWSATAGDVRWVDVAGRYPVNALAMGLHVHRNTLHGYFLRRIEEKTGRQMTPFNKDTPVPELDAWFLARLEVAPDEHGFSADEDYTAGKAVGISREKIRQLRDKHRPEGGRTPGRRPKPKLGG